VQGQHAHQEDRTASANGWVQEEDLDEAEAETGGAHKAIQRAARARPSEFLIEAVHAVQQYSNPPGLGQERGRSRRASGSGRMSPGEMGGPSCSAGGEAAS
jgi:hypothetical protein